MPLQKQTAEIVLNGGLNTKQADELQGIDSLVEAENVRYNKLGRLEKRPTYSSSEELQFSSSEAIDALFPHNGDPVGIGRTMGLGIRRGSDETTLQLNTDDSTYSKPRACRVSRLVAAATQETTQSAGIYVTASACVSGAIVTAHIVGMDSSNALLVAKAQDPETGRTIAITTHEFTPFLSVFSTVRACVISNVGDILIAWTEGASVPMSIRGMKYDVSAKSFGSVTTIVSADVDTVGFAIADSKTLVTAAGSFFVGYESTGTGNLRVRRMQFSDLTTVITTHDGTHTATRGTAITDNGTDGAMIASADATITRVEMFGAPSSVGVATSSAINVSGVSIGYASYSGTSMVVVATNDRASVSGTVVGTVNGRYTTFTPMTYASPPVADVTYTKAASGAHVISSGFTLDNDVCFAVAMYGGETTEFGTFRSGLSGLVLRIPRTENLYACDVLARFGHDRMAVADFGLSSITNISSADVVDGTLYVAHLADASESTIPLLGSGAQIAQASFVAKVQFATGAESLPLSYVELDEATMVASGELFDFDGYVPVETQPRGRPVICAETSASGSTSATFSAIVIYTFTDQAGRLHRSMPSKPVEVTVASKEVDIYVDQATTPNYSGKGNALGGSLYAQDIGYELYVTEDGGSSYYLAMTSGGLKQIVEYDTGNFPFAVFRDVVPSDGTGAPLYSDGSAGSELWSEPPPPFISITRVGDRVWGVDAEDRSRIWFSKPLVAGFAVEWNTVCTTVIGDRGVSVVDWNGTPTVLGEKGIWIVEGDGPNANGVGQFAPPRRLPYEVETICPTSPCKTPAGIIFRSRRGMSLLGQGLEPIGLPIDPLMPVTSRGHIIRTLYDEQHNEVRVIDHENGLFVYNLLESKWTQWTQAVFNQNQLDAIKAGGRVWSIQYVGDPVEWSLRRELGVDESNYNVSSEDYSLTTPWIRLDGVVGYGRFYEAQLLHMLSDTSINSTITIQVFADYDDSNEIASLAWNDASATGAIGGIASFLRVKSEQQRVTAVKIKVFVGVYADDFGGDHVVALRLTMGVQPGGRRAVDTRALKG